MMVAQIAFDRLNPRAKAEVMRLAAIPINPVSETNKSLDFITSAVWADGVRNKSGFEFSGDEHFADFPFSADGTKVPKNLPKPANVIKALKRYVGVLRTSKDDNKRAEALRFIVHYVGDIHQPLHCSARVDRNHKQGDEGGNKFFVNVGGESLKLHSFWDGGLGSFPKGGGPPDFIPPPLAEIPPAAALAMQGNPETNPGLNLSHPFNFEQWASESSDLARRKAYDGLAPNGTPDDAYTKEGARIARRRVAWAGYRLAALLNAIFPEH
jgi:S1/P1 Nuclease